MGFALHEVQHVIPQSFELPRNAWIALRFPFAIDSPKSKASVFDPSENAAAVSQLTNNVVITDELGAPIPVIATIGGIDAFGNDLSDATGFPKLSNESGKNSLTDNRVLLLIANSGASNSDPDMAGLETPSVFGGSLANPNQSTIQEIRIQVVRIGKHQVDGFWVFKIGNFAPILPLIPLTLLEIEPTKPVANPGVVEALPGITPASDFVIRFSEPVAPWSVGISKKQAKSLDFPWQKNLEKTAHPCYSSAVFPAGDEVPRNIYLIHDLLVNPTFIGFDIEAPFPNDLSVWRIKPIGKLPLGPIRLHIPTAAQNLELDNGTVISSSVTTWHNQMLRTDEGSFRDFLVVDPDN